MRYSDPSVLMLREGWDVRNVTVTVIVPLRAYSAKAQILPEQTLGRGLRRMTPPGSGVEERVVVIEHEAFRDLWDAELAELGLELERADLDDLGLQAQVIAPEPARSQFDIDVPRLGRAVVRTPEGLAALTVEDLPARRLALPDEASEDSIEYTGRDLRSGSVVEQATYALPRPDDPGSVLACCVRQIEFEGRLTGQFAVLAPLVQGYVEQRAFGQPVTLADRRVLRALARPSVQETVFEVFRQAIDAATLSEERVRADGPATALEHAAVPVVERGREGRAVGLRPAAVRQRARGAGVRASRRRARCRGLRQPDRRGGTCGSTKSRSSGTCARWSRCGTSRSWCGRPGGGSSGSGTTRPAPGRAVKSSSS